MKRESWKIAQWGEENPDLAGCSSVASRRVGSPSPCSQIHRFCVEKRIGEWSGVLCLDPLANGDNLLNPLRACPRNSRPPTAFATALMRVQTEHLRPGFIRRPRGSLLPAWRAAR